MAAFVYIIGPEAREKPIKVGHTTRSIESRLKSCQTGHPERLHLLGSTRSEDVTERLLHELLRKFRLVGEWFGPRDEVFSKIDEMGVQIDWTSIGRPEFFSLPLNEKTSDPEPPEVMLTRREAAAYLSSIGYSIAPQTLAYYASNGNKLNGPPFLRIGWSQVKYRRGELDQWAKSRMREVR